MRLLVTVLILLAAAGAQAGYADTMAGTPDELTRTLQVRSEGSDLPVALLAGGAPLEIHFDRLGSDREFLRYRAVRCEADWQPSGIPTARWTDGWDESVIEDYEFSSAVTVPYVHYRFEFPNDDIRPALSGNYLLQIYPEDDSERVLGQVRVMLSEESAPLAALITSRTDVDYNATHQQLEVSADLQRAAVDDPFNDLKLVVSQNGRLDTEVALTHPLRASRDAAHWAHDRRLVFDGGNEYRRFETVDINYPGMGVESADYRHPYYNIVLETDESRAGSQYTFYRHQWGGMLPRVSGGDADTDADYVIVHFALEYPEMPGWMFFIDGDLNYRRFDDASRLIFNPATGRYERSMLLKQGYYNYQYLAVAPGGRAGRTDIVEGDHYQTANRYTVKLYSRSRMEDTDRLLAVRQFIFQ